MLVILNKSHFVNSDALGRAERNARESQRERLRYVLAKLRDFEDLRAGWYYGRGRAITAAASEAARDLIEDAASFGLRRSNLFPGADGGVLVTLDADSNALEVRFNPDGTADFEHEAGGQEVEYEPGVTYKRAHKLTIEAARRICSFVLFTPSTLTNLREDLAARLSNLQKTVDSLSLTKPVQSEHLVPSVSIWNDTIEIKQVRQQFSGGLTNKTSQTLWQSLRTAETGTPAT